MRIAIDGRYIQNHFPGIGRYTYNLIRSLAKIAPHEEFEEEVAAMRRKYGLPACYVLYFGINKPHKNLVRLLEAWSLVFSPEINPIPGKIPLSEIQVTSVEKNWSLVIAGAWDERYPKPIERAEALRITESVRFLGPIPEEDLPALYSGAELFVFPSLYEGFGLPPLEAMACGTPVIASNASSLPEVVGEAGILIDPHDVGGLAEAIERVLMDEWKQREMPEKGLQQAARFSWERAARATLEVYHEAFEHQYLQ